MAFADDISALTSSLDRWEFGGYISAVIVAVSVAGEIAHEFGWFHSIVWWRTKGGKLSGLVLVAALVAEVVIQIKVNGMSGRVIAALERETAQANARTAEIEKLTAWRFITAENGNAMTASLKQRTAVVTLAYVANDPEVLRLAFIFSKIFDAANWKYTTSAETFPNALVADIRVLGQENDVTRLLKTALVAGNIAFTTEEHPPAVMTSISGSHETQATLFIGSKRPPF